MMPDKRLMKKWIFIAIFIGLSLVTWVMTRKSDLDHVAARPDQMSPSKASSVVALKPQFDGVASAKKGKRASRQTESNERILPKALRPGVVSKVREPSSLENYFHDEKVTIDGRPFLVSQTLRVLPKKRFDSRDGNAVTEISGYIFFESTNLSLGQPALFNEHKKSLAILTGRLLLPNSSLSRAQSIAQSLGAQLDTTMAHLNVYALSYTSDVLALQNEVGQGSVAEIVDGVVHVK